jgi:hypothetical protein
MHFAALDNLPSGSGDGEILRLATEMRKNNEPIEANVRNEVYSIYSFAVALRGGDEDLQRLLAAVPAAEQIATIQAMLYEQDFDPSRVPVREACVALLQEAAGLPDDALQTWLAMRPGIPPGAYPALAARADAAIKRLSRKSRSSASHPKGAASS